MGTKDEHGNIIGTFDTNPLLITMIYDVEFMDGNIREFGGNIIAENMYSQVDNDGYYRSILESIIDFRKNTKAISKDNMHIMTKSGQRRLRKSTVGWDFRVSWSDGSESWVPLSLLKNSYPIETA